MNKSIASAFIAALAAISLAAPACAADLPAREYRPPPVVAPVPAYDWSGFYIGGNIGGAWDSSTSTNRALDGTFVSSGSGNNSGVIGGGQIGYTFMASPNFLLGREADVEGSSRTGSVASIDGSNIHNSKLDDFCTARGRAGFTVNNWLFYGTGGFAWSDGTESRSQLATVVATPPIPAVGGSVESVSTPEPAGPRAPAWNGD